MSKYASFAEAFESDKTHDDWTNDFVEMTREDFFDFFTYVFPNRVSKLVQNGDADSMIVFRTKLTLMGALCAKLMEFGHFGEGLTNDQRIGAINNAEMYVDVIMHIFRDNPIGERFGAAWASTREHCEKFGYRAGPVYEVLRPHRVFLDV